MAESDHSLARPLQLQTRPNKMPALWVSVLAEFIGTFLFQLLGGSERTGLYNGVVLTVLIYMTGRDAHSSLSPFPHSPDT